MTIETLMIALQGCHDDMERWSECEEMIFVSIFYSQVLLVFLEVYKSLGEELVIFIP